MMDRRSRGRSGAPMIAGRGIGERAAETSNGAAQSGDGEVDASARAALGRRIRELRMKRGISGRQLATSAALTSGFISQLESGIANPSVATLVRLAAILDVHVGDFFEGQRPAGTLLRRDDRVRYEYPDLGIEEELLCVDRNLGVCWARLAPGASSGEELFQHGSDAEFVLVTKGTVIIQIGDDEYRVRAGDSVHFSGHTPHGCRNDTRSPAELIWAVTPATY